MKLKSIISKINASAVILVCLTLMALASSTIPVCAASVSAPPQDNPPPAHPPGWLDGDTPQIASCKPGRPSGEAASRFYKIANGLLSFFTAALAVAFFANMAMTMLEAQLALATGAGLRYAEAIQQAIWAILALVLGGAIGSVMGPITTKVESMVCTLSGSSVQAMADATIDVWGFGVRLLVSILLSGAAAVSIGGLISSGLGAQASGMLGMAGGASRMIMKSLSIGLGLVATLGVVALTNAIIGAIF